MVGPLSLWLGLVLGDRGEGGERGIAPRWESVAFGRELAFHEPAWPRPRSVMAREPRRGPDASSARRPSCNESRNGEGGRPTCHGRRRPFQDPTGTSDVIKRRSVATEASREHVRGRAVGGSVIVVASVQVQGSWIRRRPCSWQQAPRVSTHARSLLPGGSPFRSEWQPLPAMSTHRGSSLPLSYGRRGEQLGEFDLPGLPWQREPDVSAHIGSLLPRGLPSGSGWQPLDGERGGRIGLVSPDAGGLCPEEDGGSSPLYRGANPSTSDAGGWGRRAVVSVTSGVSGRGGARPNFLQKFGIDACQSGTFC